MVRRKMHIVSPPQHGFDHGVLRNRADEDVVNVGAKFAANLIKGCFPSKHVTELVGVAVLLDDRAAIHDEYRYPSHDEELDGVGKCHLGQLEWGHFPAKDALRGLEF